VSERRDHPRFIAEEWLSELRRRLHRSALLLDHGLPDPGFDLLAEEIRLFKNIIQGTKK